MQRQIDSRIDSRLTDLEEAVTMLGNQIISIQRQIHLGCDWNITRYCITPLKWNQMHFAWGTVRKHLLINGNIAGKIAELQKEIDVTYAKNLEVLTSADIWEGIAQGICDLNPLNHFEGIKSTILICAACSLLLLLCFCIVSRWHQQQQ